MADSALTLYTVVEVSMIMGVPESELEDKIVALGIKKVEDDSSGKPLYDVNDFKGI